jgi:hypothetical protein
MNRVISDIAMCRRAFGEIVILHRMLKINDPPRGLQRIYDRLQEHYGRPEMVESAMKRKLNLFPTLTNKQCETL